MGTNTFIIGGAEPFGLDDRRDIFREIALQEVRQNFFARRLGGALPPAGTMIKRRMLQARFPLPAP
jgi:hypothetical protein